MSQSVSLSRNQERFVQALLLGKTIVDAAKDAGVTNQTAHRWLKDPIVQAERTAREKALAEVEQAKIEKILTTGYAAIHERVKALDRQAHDMEEPYVTVKGKEIPLHHMPERLREWRGLLDDIAKELGQRIKKQEIEHSGLVELLNAEHASLLADLEGLPDVTADQKQTEAGDTGADSAVSSA